eukprot:1566973-Pyramimonas_sp.AAC.1
MQHGCDIVIAYSFGEVSGSVTTCPTSPVTPGFTPDAHVTAAYGFRPNYVHLCRAYNDGAS